VVVRAILIIATLVGTLAVRSATAATVARVDPACAPGAHVYCGTGLDVNDPLGGSRWESE
jgi:hypothetical protein